MRVWPHHAQGAWHLYGHSHGNLPDEPFALSLDIGVDTHDFRPWHFDELRAVMMGNAASLVGKLSHDVVKSSALQTGNQFAADQNAALQL
jgi:hypothetical protein